VKGDLAGEPRHTREQPGGRSARMKRQVGEASVSRHRERDGDLDLMNTKPWIDPGESSQVFFVSFDPYVTFVSPSVD
jgi:hypothetical protein